MSRYLAAFTLLLLALYGGFKALPLLSGPSIHLTSPQEAERFDSGLVVLSGVAEHTENLYLNGSILPIDAEGRFSTTLTLPHGGAILSLTATDRFGKEIRTRRSVFVPN
jgi:hypothetical protein